MLTSPENSSAWLDAIIARSQNRITTDVVELSPARARVLLARNPDNRRISLEKVAEYARDIENGRWPLNGEPIIVSKCGWLNDGQHRCEAVIATGVTILVVLVVGPERETRFTVDQGRARIIGDFLGMDGHSHANTLGAAAGYLWQYESRSQLAQGTKARPNKSEIRECVARHPDLVKSIAAIPTSGSSIVGGQSLLVFCHYVFSRRSPVADVDEFMAKLQSGVDLSGNDPILYARTRFIQQRGRLKLNEKAELIFRAWNAHRRGERPTKLPLLNGPLPPVER